MALGGWLIPIVAVGIGIYDLIEHWDAVKKYFGSINWAGDFHKIVAAVMNFGTEIFTAGAHLMSRLADGIKSLAMAPVHAVAGVLSKIWDWLPHSPAKEGPFSHLGEIRFTGSNRQHDRIRAARWRNVGCT